jgi:hypothetical protein
MPYIRKDFELSISIFVFFRLSFFGFRAYFMYFRTFLMISSIVKFALMR